MATNDITGDALRSKVTTENFRTGFDGIDWSDKGNPIKPKPKPTDKEVRLYVPLRD